MSQLQQMHEKTPFLHQTKATELHLLLSYLCKEFILLMHI